METVPETASFDPLVDHGGADTEQAAEAVVYLPPGFRFHPTDEEIIVDYLKKKVTDIAFSSVAIGEVDLNKCEPWDLPRKAKMMGKKEWFFFWQKDRKYPTGTRTNRATESGYWKATGKDKEIFQSGRGSSSSSGSIVGMKKTLVFYKGRAPKGQKTNWIMHEYRLHGTQFYNTTREEWVVCRVFHKQTTGVVYMRRSPPRNDAVSRIDSISVADHLLPPLTDFPDYSDDKPPAPPLLPCSLTFQNPPSAVFYPPNPNSDTATAALKAESVSQDAAGVVSPDVTPTEISWELPDGGGALGGLYDDSMADLDRYYSFLNYY